MFWKSIVDGIGVLFTHWEIWVSILIYFLIFLSYFIIFGYILMRNDQTEGVKKGGCITNMMAGPLLQGLLVTLLVTTILPIFLGGNDFIPKSFLIENWWVITKAGIFSIGITIIMMFLPIIGRFISDIPGTAIFVQGAIVFHFLSNSTLFATLNYFNSDADIFPGFWVSIGFLIFAITVVYLFSIGLITLLSAFISRITIDSYGFIIVNFIGVIPGILTICIYTSYIKLNLMNVVTSTGLQ